MDVIMPQMGESIAEGTIVKWLKKPGDTVEKDEPLFEISTDKVDAEIPSPADGVLSEILVTEGNTVEVNTVVARIGDAGSAAAAAPAPKAEARPEAKEEKPAPAPAPAPAAKAEPAPSAPSSAPAPRQPAPAPSGGGVATMEERLKVRSSPLVRKIAAEHGIDLTQVEGTGISGRVTKADVESYLDRMESPAAAPTAAPAAAKPAAPAPAAAPHAPVITPKAGDRVEPLSIMRLKIAEHMVESRRTSAHVQTFWEVDVSHLAKLRKSHGEEYLKRNGVKLSFTTFFAKAACDALKAVPIVNASMSGSDVIYHGSINLGIAVSLDWGLIVPVIKSAGDMNLGGLGKSIADLAARARSKKLSPDEVTGGTFTITNPGIYGGLFGAPIINQPQVAILGLGAIEKRPVVVNDAIAIREMCYISLSFDHRLIDGSVAEEFMGELKQSLLAIDESSL
ncbi:MAG: 2-oxoglutarate dehydrogenase, E2 component, dihydrolipoamide succinyltransferase [Gemmatimonadetes bacterium]|nr:2-oxoglutarate dehydrogenase, E2 component, dihydrolipoamide succinyltransferase [Gemmatimonadota bacterium]